MKSRFLSSVTGLMVLLLGLVNANLFAQISDITTVDFAIMPYNVNNSPISTFSNAASAADTAGYKFATKISWEARQDLAAEYTITFPKGAVLYASEVVDSVFLERIDQSGTSIVQISSSAITVQTPNDTTGYSSTVRPSIKISDSATFTAVKSYNLYIYKGLRFPKSVASANESVLQGSYKNMKMSFNHSISSPSTVTDSTFYLLPGKPDGIVMNTSVSGYIDNTNWPSVDSMVVVDRFGNKIGNTTGITFMGSSADTIQISVAAGEGKFNDDAVVTGSVAYTNNLIKYNSDSTAILLIGGGNASAGLDTDVQTTVYDPGALYHVLDNGDDAQKSLVIILGNRGTTAGTSVGAINLKFDAAANKDSTAFVFTLKGPNVSNAKVLNEAADHVTTVSRDILPSTASKNIGSLDLSLSSRGPFYNGLPMFTGANDANFYIEIKNVFGDKFTAASELGTVSDSVVFEFRYMRGADTLNTSMTTIVQSGTTVGGYSRPASRFKNPLVDESDRGTWADKSTGTNGNYLVGGAFDSNSRVNLGYSIYYGTTSWQSANRDSIMVVAYAKNNTSVRDSVKMYVLPSPPIVWDVSLFADSLQKAINDSVIVSGSTIPMTMPIYALDTAYNYVGNLDLQDGAKFLGTLASPADDAINLLIDGRDPLINGTIDSIFVGTDAVGDQSSITNINNTGYSDRSKLNLGGSGSNPLGLVLRYTGVAYTISIQHLRGTGPASDSTNTYATAVAANHTKRTDLGQFYLASASAVDSAQSLTLVSSSGKAGATQQLTFKFTAPTGNSVGPNLADSLVFVKFIVPNGGIMSGITKDSVWTSEDGVNFYKALGVAQGESDKDSLKIAVSSLANASSSSDDMWIRIGGFTNPTESDTSYAARLYTEASPVKCRNNSLVSVVDNDYASIKLVAPGQSVAKITQSYSDVSGTATTLRAGDEAELNMLFGDANGNIRSVSYGTSYNLIFKGPDSTATGKSTALRHVFAGATVTGRGNAMYDSLTAVKTDTLNVGATLTYTFVDSLFVRPVVAGSYYLVAFDSAKTTAIDSIMLTVKPTIAGSVALSPSGTIEGTQSAVVDDTLMVTLSDTLGNVLADSTVRFYVSSGSGDIIAVNGSAITAADTASGTTNASGVVTAVVQAGISDTLKITVDVVGSTKVAAKTYTITTTKPSTTNQITFKTVPDSLIQDTTNAQWVTITVRDPENVKYVQLMSIVTMLEQQEDGTFALAATSDTTAEDDSTYATLADSVNFMGMIGAKSLADFVTYEFKVVDNGNDTTMNTMDAVTGNDGDYLITPKRGKQDLTQNATNVADLMRTVYLVLGAQGIVQRTIDFLGLDLDGSGAFGGADLDSVLAKWRGTSLLAGAADKDEQRTAKLSLDFVTVPNENASANLNINLENTGSLNRMIIDINYDADKFALGEIQKTERLGDVDAYFVNNEAEGTYRIVVISMNGNPIYSGSGSILTIPVTSTGDKFDGMGEIKLAKGDFEGDVATEISSEALAPKIDLPKAFALGQNFPNPFNPSTTIAYAVPEGDEVQVRLNIYNIRGQLVSTLVNEVKVAGNYQVQWDGSDNNGRQVSSGVYFYRIQAGDFSQTRKMVILK